MQPRSTFRVAPTLNLAKQPGRVEGENGKNVSAPRGADRVPCVTHSLGVGWPHYAVSYGSYLSITLTNHIMFKIKWYIDDFRK